MSTPPIVMGCFQSACIGSQTRMSRGKAQREARRRIASDYVTDAVYHEGVPFKLLTVDHTFIRRLRVTCLLPAPLSTNTGVSLHSACG